MSKLENNSFFDGLDVAVSKLESSFIEPVSYGSDIIQKLSELSEPNNKLNEVNSLPPAAVTQRVKLR